MTEKREKETDYFPLSKSLRVFNDIPLIKVCRSVLYVLERKVCEIGFLLLKHYSDNVPVTWPAN